MQQSVIAVLIGCLLSLSTPVSQAQTNAHSTVMLIGGGYTLDSSQGQIELNTQWVQDILKQRGLPVSTYYTDGDAPKPDVHYLQPWQHFSSTLEPLSRIYNQLDAERTRYRNHRVADVSGSTHTDIVVPALQALFEAQPQSDVMMIYNGHGHQSQSTPDRVSLQLWDDTRLYASDLHKKLGIRSRPFRFIMTQCYSGGFHRVIYQDSARGHKLAEGAPRCGFTAESAYRLSEGCSSSIDSSDYRDYTTFFFAALSGTDRNGQPLGMEPDRNGDGQTTMREAHLYTLTEALSTDLPLSSSEDYLLSWQPWTLKWLPYPTRQPDNEYRALFTEVAQKYNFDPNSPSIAKAIRARVADITQEQQRLTEQFAAAQQSVSQLQQLLKEQLSREHPALNTPYTTAFFELIKTDGYAEAAKTIENTPEYRELVQQQNRQEQLETDLLNNERQLTQMQKLQHLRRLSVLHQQLLDYGTAADIERYNTLVECEDTAL